MSACHLYYVKNTGLASYFCEINQKVYNSIVDCVNNCGIGIDGEMIFPNVGYEGYFFILLGLAILIAWGLMNVILDW